MTLGYRSSLDGIRGVAIALVVSFHAFGWPPGGTLGVDLFFVLSGFLITTLLVEERNARGAIDIVAFYRRRARRLLPALFVMLAPFFLLAVVSAAAGTFRQALFVGLAGAATYSSNIVVAADPSAVPAALIHLWSLAEEEQFYIFWPLLLVVLLRFGGARLAVRALALLLLVAVAYRMELLLRGATIGRLYYGPDTHADSLLIGCGLGCLFVRRGLPSLLHTSSRARNAIGTTAFAFVIGTALLIGHVPQRTAYWSLLVPTAFAALAGIALACLMSGPSVLERFLSLRPLTGLGRISYSLYLWHLPLLVALAGLHREFGLRTLTAVVLAAAVATASRWFVELPFIRRRTTVDEVAAAAAVAAA